MNRMLPGCLVILTGIAGQGDVYGQEGLAAGPLLRLSASEINFGEIQPDEVHSRSVQVTNEGSGPVELSFTTSCSCTKVTINKAALGVRESAELRVRLDLAAYPSNEVLSMVTLRTRGSFNEEHVLTVKGALPPIYTVAPAALEFGEVKAGQETSLEVKVTSARGVALGIEGVEVTDGLRIEPQERGGKAESHTFKVSLVSDPTQGVYRGKVRITTDAVREAEIEVPVSAEIVGVEYSLSSPVLVCGTLKPGEKTPVIELSGLPALRVKFIQSTVEEIRFEYEKTHVPGTYRIWGTVKPHAVPGLIRGTVRVLLEEDSLQETAEIHVVGRIMEDE